jgi:hypothetical protein
MTQVKRELSKVNQVQVRRESLLAGSKKRRGKCFMYMSRIEQIAYGKEADTVRDRIDTFTVIFHVNYRIFNPKLNLA